jgi:DNA-directed RNA polymerase II subunit RPB1
MTLNTFHFAGVASKSNVLRGVPRIEEILTLSDNPKNPSLTIALKKDDEDSIDRATSVMNMIEYTTLSNLVNSIEIRFAPKTATQNQFDIEMIHFNEFEKILMETNGEQSEIEFEGYNWVIYMKIDPNELLDKNITMDDINYVLKNVYGNDILTTYTDYNSDNLIFRIDLIQKKKAALESLDQTDEIHILKNFQEQLLNNIIIRGVKNIKKVLLRKSIGNLEKQEGAFVEKDKWVLDTDGTNLLDILGVDYIDVNNTITTHIVEVYRVLGIEAARTAIFNELLDVIEFDGTYINYHHINLLCDRMTNSFKMISIFRHGINNDNIGPIAKASFEETPEMFIKAAKHGELDMMRGVSANVMCGQEGLFGTNSFQVLTDMDKMIEMAGDEVEEEEETNIDDEITAMFGMIDDPNDKCSMQNIAINNTGVNIGQQEMGLDDDYELEF